MMTHIHSSGPRAGKVLLLILILAITLSLPATGSGEREESVARDLETGIRDLAASLTKAMGGKGVSRLAVVDFTDIRGYSSALEIFIAEELITQLFVVSPDKFSVVERRQLTRVLEEQKLTSSALFDQEAIATIGRILGIDTIVTGSIAELGDYVKINARAISVETAQVFAAASTRVPRKGDVEDLLLQGSGGGATLATPERNRRHVQASDVFFQNQELRLTVESIGVADDKRFATLALMLENLTSEALMLTLDSQSQACTASLTDSGGHLLVGDHVTGLSCSYNVERERGEGFTEFAAKSRSTIVIRFELRQGGEVTGNIFSFGAEFIKLKNGRQMRFSAGISNIELN